MLYEEATAATEKYGVEECGPLEVVINSLWIILDLQPSFEMNSVKGKNVQMTHK